MATKGLRDVTQQVVCISPEFDTEDESNSSLMDRAGRTLRQGVPSAATALVLGAEKGGITHIKLMFDLIGLEKGAFASREGRPKEKTLEQICLEEWRREP